MHYTESITRNHCPHRGYLGQSDIAYCPYPSLYIDEEKNDYCYQCQWRIRGEREKAEVKKVQAAKVKAVGLEAVRIEAAKLETANIKAAKDEAARFEDTRKTEQARKAEEAKTAEFERELGEAFSKCRADEEEKKMFWPEGRMQYSRDVRERVARHGQRSWSPKSSGESSLR